MKIKYFDFSAFHFLHAIDLYHRGQDEVVGLASKAHYCVNARSLWQSLSPDAVVKYSAQSFLLLVILFSTTTTL